MKKYVFKFMTFFVMCMTSLIIISCSDNEDDYQVDKSSLVGKWVLINLVYEVESENDSDSYDVSEEVDVILLNEDGSCRNYCKPIEQAAPGIDPYDWNDYGEWDLVNSISLKLLFYGEGQQIVKVLKMTTTTLSFECSLSSEGETYKYTATYKKVS